MFAVLYACPFYSQRSDAVQRIKVKKADSTEDGKVARCRFYVFIVKIASRPKTHRHLSRNIQTSELLDEFGSEFSNCSLRAAMLVCPVPFWEKSLFFRQSFRSCCKSSRIVQYWQDRMADKQRGLPLHVSTEIV